MSTSAILAPEGDTSRLPRRRTLTIVLAVATAVVFYVCYRLAEPFLPVLAWAAALAIVARPMHAWLARHIKHPGLAAGLAVALVAVTIIAPAAFVVHTLINEAASKIEQVRTNGAEVPVPAEIERYPALSPLVRWVQENVDIDNEVRGLIGKLTGSIAGVFTGSIWAGVQLLLVLFALFYFFRDRALVLDTVRSLLPLSEGETDKVFARVADTVHATVFGTILVAIVQGVLGGLMFWWLGLPAPVLWGAVMALLAVVPWLGAFVVWAPAALFLALSGSWGKALLLAAWGTIAVGLIDNLLYPILVGNRMRLHTLPVFFAILGGLALFGGAGIILGPVILAVADALVQVWRRRTAPVPTAKPSE